MYRTNPLNVDTLSMYNHIALLKSLKLNAASTCKLFQCANLLAVQTLWMHKPSLPTEPFKVKVVSKCKHYISRMRLQTVSIYKPLRHGNPLMFKKSSLYKRFHFANPFTNAQLQAGSIFKFGNMKRGTLPVGRTTSAEVVVFWF